MVLGEIAGERRGQVVAQRHPLLVVVLEREDALVRPVLVGQEFAERLGVFGERRLHRLEAVALVDRADRRDHLLGGADIGGAAVGEAARQARLDQGLVGRHGDIQTGVRERPGNVSAASGVGLPHHYESGKVTSGFVVIAPCRSDASRNQSSTVIGYGVQDPFFPGFAEIAMSKETDDRIASVVAEAGVATMAYPHGGVIFVKDDPADCAYVVAAGRVEIRETGRALESIGPGEIFGEVGMIDGGPRSASAVAVGATEVHVIDRSTFDRLVREKPAIRRGDHARHGPPAARHERPAATVDATSAGAKPAGAQDVRLESENVRQFESSGHRFVKGGRKDAGAQQNIGERRMPGTTFDIEVIAAADLGVVSLFDGGVVFARGDAADCAYIIQSGSVEIRGVGCSIEVIGPGEIFGAAALLDDRRGPARRWRSAKPNSSRSTGRFSTPWSATIRTSR